MSPVRPNPLDWIDPEASERALAFARQQGVSIDNPTVRGLIARTGSVAPSLVSLLVSDPTLPMLLADEIRREGVIMAVTRDHRVPLVDPVDTAGTRLRKWRNVALVRTALREIHQHADVDRTSREWSFVADRCIQLALDAAMALTTARSGPALDSAGTAVPFVVLGMGKLGGQELNLGSDIDVCYFYGTDEGSAGERTLNEYFARVSSIMSETLSAITEDGFVFRVDLRLRPEGSRGALANSLVSAERYYETWGRAWERAALVRARPCAGHLATGGRLLDMLRPFVWRRSVDPSVAVDMARMLERSRHELLRDDLHDLKIGSGGIREAEFFIQSLQLIWGGRHPSLRVTGTLHATARLHAVGLLSHRERSLFEDAWAVLRRTEHRVQSLAGYSTHLVPSDPVRCNLIARSLGYADAQALMNALRRARAVVRSLFETLFPQSSSAAGVKASPESFLCDEVADHLSALPGGVLLDDKQRDQIQTLVRETLGVRDIDTALDDLRRLARRPDLPLGPVGRERHPTLGPRLLTEVRDAPDPDLALTHLALLFERVSSAEQYALRLADAPDKARGLVGLFGASAMLASTLLAHPEWLDMVVSGGTSAPDAEKIALEVARAAMLSRPDGDDPTMHAERLVGALRRVHREVMLLVGLADMTGALTAGEVARRLSCTADAIIDACFRHAARECAQRYGTCSTQGDPLAGVSVFSLGSLAAREMGYGADIDLIVLFEREGETSGGTRGSVSVTEYVARLAQRAIALLSAPHAEGPGFSVDTRLRPSGAQGTLVVALDAFVRYHSPGVRAERASASSWERQALIRSRFCTGDRVFGQRVENAIQHVAYEQGPADLSEVVRLREKMDHELGRSRLSHPGAPLELKYSPGGLVDIEFIVQTLQMKHGERLDVRSPTTRDAIRRLMRAGCLSMHDGDWLLIAERALRRTILAARLVSSAPVIRPGTAQASTVARRLGYRDRGGMSAEQLLLSDIGEVRTRTRAAFERLISPPG